MSLYTLAGEHGSCTVLSFGAQLLSWKLPDSQEQLYLSPRTQLDGSVAIRGGVPICFPQFNLRVIGQHALAKHGFARQLPWQMTDQSENKLCFSLDSSEQTLKWWPYAFSARLGVSLEPRGLRVAMQVLNTGQVTMPFALALHTYLRVSDVRQVALHGLQDVPFWDAVKHLQRPDVRNFDADPLRFGTEIDRVYANAPRELILRDGERQMRVVSSASLPDTVVWNPGPALCAKLVDMPPDGWQHMLCVEAACIQAPVRLEPAQSWEGWQFLQLG